MSTTEGTRAMYDDQNRAGASEAATEDRANALRQLMRWTWDDIDNDRNKHYAIAMAATEWDGNDDDDGRDLIDCYMQDYLTNE